MSFRSTEMGRPVSARSFDLFPLWVFLSPRVAVLGCWYVGLRPWPHLYLHEERRNVILRSHPALDGLCRWDCSWYELIARSGYAQPSYSEIWPLYPLVSGRISDLTGMPIPFAQLLVANLASL